MSDDNSPKRLAYEVKMMGHSVASHGPAALTTTTDPMYSWELLRRLSDALCRLDAAYQEVVNEYADARRDRQEQMTRIRAALDDAYRGARTGNLVTPHWVVQSIDDALEAGGWTLPPHSAEQDHGEQERR